MTTLANGPVVQALFNEHKSKRQERRVFAAPLSELTSEDSIVIDLALNNVITEDSVLPLEIEQHLMIATNFFYQVSNYKGVDEYPQSILVTFDGNQNQIKIYIQDKADNTITVKKYFVVTPEMGDMLITKNLSKTTYLENAARLVKESVLQYSDELATVYRLLFHVVYQTEFIKPDDVDNIEAALVSLLQDTEVTLHLNVTNTIKLYGDIDSENFLNLYIREIGTPDTYWSRSVLLPELLDHSLRH